MESNGFILTHQPCPKCGSSDALSINDKGWGRCFSCGTSVPPDSGNKEATPAKMTKPSKPLIPLDSITYSAIPNRGLSEETCRRWGYGYAKGYNPKTEDTARCHVATYRTHDGPVFQKLRFANKVFSSLGDSKAAPLFGQHLWGQGGRMVVVTEGEIDAMSVSQVQDHKWPVVSLANGAQSAVQAMAKAKAWLDTFEKIVLMFDNDDAGQAAVKAVAKAWPPGRIFVANLPLDFKDANEALLAGREDAIIQAIWKAKVYRPDGIVSVGEVKKLAKAPPAIENPWPWPELTRYTYGRRFGEIIGVGAGTSVGKTDFITQCIAHDISELGHTVGAIYYEQVPTDTLDRVAGKLAHKRLHVPSEDLTPEVLAEARAKVPDEKLYLYDHFGAKDWATTKETIEFMATGLGCRAIYLDHLTALVAGEQDENAALKVIMEEMASLALRLGIIIVFISHLSTPEGKPHENGGMVMVRHFRGSRTIGMWAHVLFGLERNQQASDPTDRNTLVVRILKERLAGGTGKTLALHYSDQTGLLRPRDDDEDHFEPEEPDAL